MIATTQRLLFSFNTEQVLVQGETAMLRRQVGESEGEVQVLLSQLAVQSKLAIASSKELTQLHDLIRKLENQHSLVSAHVSLVARQQIYKTLSQE